MLENGLLYREEVPLSEPLPSVLSQIIAKMQSSHMHFQFPQRPSLLAPHENLPLQLLRPVSRGIPRSSDGRVLLRPEPISAGSTLGDIVRDLAGSTGPTGLGQNIDGDTFLLRLRKLSLLHCNFFSKVHLQVFAPRLSRTLRMGESITVLHFTSMQAFEMMAMLLVPAEDSPKMMRIAQVVKLRLQQMTRLR